MTILWMAIIIIITTTTIIVIIIFFFFFFFCIIIIINNIIGTSSVSSCTSGMAGRQPMSFNKNASFNGPCLITWSNAVKHT